MWYLALASAAGVVVAVSDVASAKAALYRARHQSGDPILAGLQLRTSPDHPKEQLWIVKGAQNGPQS